MSGAPYTSSLLYVPNLAFHLYRRCRLGLALFDALHECLEASLISPQLAYSIVQQYDHSVAKELARTRRQKDVFRFVAERLLTYRIVDGMVAVVLSNMHLYRLEDVQEEDEGSLGLWKAKGLAKMVKVGTVERVVLLTYSPFADMMERPGEDVNNVEVGGVKCRIRTISENVNPRLEFFVFEERTKTKTKTKTKLKKDIHREPKPSTHCMELRPLESRWGDILLIRSSFR